MSEKKTGRIITSKEMEVQRGQHLLREKELLEKIVQLTEKKPFTPAERKIWDLISEAHARFAKLDTTHPDELREWIDAVHALQDVLGWRILRRDYPDDFLTWDGKL